MKPRTEKLLGLLLIVTAVAGYLTVADELHHTGEFFAVTGVLIAGLALFASGRYPNIATRLSLRWVPIGVGIGMLVGAYFDEEVIGVCVGSLLGTLLARALRRKPPQREPHVA